ncbi:hypothetical protein F0562_027878 [Nyssa sinensis]|uniref:DUF7358 domain-containing protein n=1 Tax=Nyssa sinensis TaxID=561372 RepID=A0A5J5B6D0_9ASTE|nr:hypothetical protein F0562_027878 [Nyssa sinensis]
MSKSLESLVDQVLSIAPGYENAIRCKIVALIKADNISEVLSTIKSSRRLPVDTIFFKETYNITDGSSSAKNLRWATVIRGVSNVLVIILSVISMVLVYPSSGHKDILPFLLISLASGGRITAIIPTRIAQQTAAVMIFKSQAVETAALLLQFFPPQALLRRDPLLQSVHASGCQDMLVETIQNQQFDDKEKEMASVLLSDLYDDMISSTRTNQGFIIDSTDDLTVGILDTVDILALFTARTMVNDIRSLSTDPPVASANCSTNLKAAFKF